MENDITLVIIIPTNLEWKPHNAIFGNEKFSRQNSRFLFFQTSQIRYIIKVKLKLILQQHILHK